MTYLDLNATTPVLPEAMRPSFCEEWGEELRLTRFQKRLL